MGSETFFAPQFNSVTDLFQWICHIDGNTANTLEFAVVAHLFEVVVLHPAREFIYELGDHRERGGQVQLFHPGGV